MNLILYKEPRINTLNSRSLQAAGRERIRINKYSPQKKCSESGGSSKMGMWVMSTESSLEGKGAFRGRDISAGSREANGALPGEVSSCSRKHMYITQREQSR